MRAAGRSATTLEQMSKCIVSSRYSSISIRVPAITVRFSNG
jgi:hypothetical protein